MTGSTTGIIVIVVVVVVCLVVWLGSVALAARRPAREHPQHDPLRGLVQGGQHVGGGRSVAPRQAGTGRRRRPARTRFITNGVGARLPEPVKQ